MGNSSSSTPASPCVESPSIPQPSAPPSAKSILDTTCYFVSLNHNLSARILQWLPFELYPTLVTTCKQWQSVLQSKDLIWESWMQSEFRYVCTILNEHMQVRTCEQNFWKNTFTENFMERRRFFLELETQLDDVQIMKRIDIEANNNG
jgi:hypothetical protein